MYIVRWFYENKWRQRECKDFKTAAFDRMMLMKKASIAKYGVTISKA